MHTNEFTSNHPFDKELPSTPAPVPLTVTSTSNPLADPIALAWLNHLAGPATHLAIGAKLPDGKKAYYPTEIRDDADRRALIESHLTGTLQPRLCLRQGESFLIEQPFALGYFTIQRADSQFVVHALTFDIDGPGHANGLTPEQVEAQTWDIAALAEEAGLEPTVVRSNSGKGRHVIVTFPEPVDAGLAVFIAKGILALVPGAEKTEIFPRTATLRDGQFGRLVAFPLNGSAPHPGGGRIIDRHGQELPVSSVRIPDSESIAAFIPLYERQKGADAAIRAARQAEGTMFAHGAHAAGQDANASQATIEHVARAFAEIADDRETEPDIIGIRCPTHGGTCFHINPEIGWFYCHKCEHKGAGPGAPFMLLKLLRPDWTPAQIRAELSALTSHSSVATPLTGVTP